MAVVLLMARSVRRWRYRRPLDPLLDMLPHAPICSGWAEAWRQPTSTRLAFLRSSRLRRWLGRFHGLALHEFAPCRWALRDADALLEASTTAIHDFANLLVDGQQDRVMAPRVAVLPEGCLTLIQDVLERALIVAAQRARRILDLTPPLQQRGRRILIFDSFNGPLEQRVIVVVNGSLPQLVLSHDAIPFAPFGKVLEPCSLKVPRFIDPVVQNLQYRRTFFPLLCRVLACWLRVASYASASNGAHVEHCIVLRFLQQLLEF